MKHKSQIEDGWQRISPIYQGISLYFGNVRPRRVVASAVIAIHPLSYRLIIASISLVGGPHTAHYRPPVYDYLKGTRHIKNFVWAYINSIWKGRSIGVISWAKLPRKDSVGRRWRPPWLSAFIVGVVCVLKMKIFGGKCSPPRNGYCTSSHCIQKVLEMPATPYHLKGNTRFLQAPFAQFSTNPQSMI